jgi:anaerobic selenocysteine-containing dehydrogenase/NADPH-dependent glutamate synthase beta subunit-like oxidoreductase
MEVVDGKIISVEDDSRNRVPPCKEACPLGTDVPRYVALVSQGRFEEALEVIRETNPLPAICSRICHHPCELDCSWNAMAEPVAVRALKRAALEHASKSELKPLPLLRTRPEKVAIVGSGPAGLTAANDLIRAGYGVTVYEAAAIAGGIPATVIPEFILPLAVMQADISAIEALGVKFVLNTTVGKDLSLQDLQRQHQAVIIATGCPKSLDLKIPGSDLAGIYPALAFLAAVKNLNGPRINGNAVIIGGGDTALDAARMALRTGANRVAVVCLEGRNEMAANPGDLARIEEEGVSIYPRLAPQCFLNDGTGKVAGIEFQRVAAFEKGSEGEIFWTLAEGAENRLKISAHAVIVAIGQAANADSVVGNGYEFTTPQGTLSVDPATMATPLPGLFACGDVMSGPSNVVESMATGRRAARSVVAYLTGGAHSQIEEQSLQIEVAGPRPPNAGARHPMPSLEPSVAVSALDEVELGYSRQQSIDEAARCLNCLTCCPKGVTIPDVMYHPDRLLYPLKRTAGRGDGKWARLSWEEALNTIAGRLKAIQEKHGPAAVAVSCGSGQKHVGVQALSICKKMWPTPNTHWGRYTCDTPDDMNNAVTFGDLITYEFGPDYEHSRCIVFWGSNPNVGTPAQTRDVYRAIRTGAKLMVIDPRPTPMARRADLWLRIRPGTDMALALAMQHVIIQEKLYDQQFVEKWCVGFKRLKTHVQNYPVDKAAAITGLSEEEIVKAARLYANNRPGCIYVRLGAGGQQVNSTQTGRAIAILIALCGNVDTPGGNLLYYRTFRDHLFWHAYDMGKGIKGPGAVEEMRFGAEEYPLMHHEAVCDMPGMVRGMENGQVKALWCLADNLVVAEMNSRKIWQLMRDKLEFVFVSDFFMTPTAELADIVLPAAFFTETDILAGEYLYPANHVMASAKLVEPCGECRDDRQVAIEIAKRLGRDVSPWETVKDYLNWRLRYLGLTFDELCARPDARIVLPREFRRYERSDPPFNTASGKIELYSSVFESIGVDPLPVYQEPPQSPRSTPALHREFPLIYTHYRLWPYMHSEGRQIPGQRNLIPEPYLEMNPDTGQNYGIQEGDRVYLETPHSRGKDRISFKVRFVPEMHPDVVAGPHAWWLPEKPGPDHGCFESNINTLLKLDPPYDPVVGNVQCRAILCRISKAPNG